MLLTFHLYINAHTGQQQQLGAFGQQQQGMIPGAAGMGQFGAQQPGLAGASPFNAFGAKTGIGAAQTMGQFAAPPAVQQVVQQQVIIPAPPIPQTIILGVAHGDRPLFRPTLDRDSK